MNSLNTSLRVLLPYLEELGTVRSLSVAMMLRRGEWAEIMSLKTDPRNYGDALSYFRDAQSTDLLRKIRMDVPGINRKAASLRKWLDGESQCYLSNERLSAFSLGGLPPEGMETIGAFFSSARKIIRSWIGEKPPSRESVVGRFGPGSTFSDRGPLTTVPDKMTSIPTLTRLAERYIFAYRATSWGRSNSLVTGGQLATVRGNRFFTVHKTGLIDRAIAIEPAMNVFYQLGLGGVLRDRLKANTGWDLAHAQEIHRRMARESSVTREYCTLDLSNASDTVCIELVRLLLPDAWFQELNSLRSPFTQVDGRWHKLEKFSSMGNGFTFELETLIFAALCAAMLRREGRPGRLGEDLFVFGDDIILPDEFYSTVEPILRYCGFSLNREKSFHGDTPFRESCGGDYFDGHDVRSFFMKDLVNDPWALLPTYNGLRASLEKLASLRRWPSKGESLRALVAVMPTDVRRCTGPRELGDCVLHTPRERQWNYRWKHGIRYFRALKMIPTFISWEHWKGETVLASALYGVGSGALGVIPRGSVPSFKVGWVPLS
jgi:hypothetical protein